VVDAHVFALQHPVKGRVILAEIVPSPHDLRDLRQTDIVISSLKLKNVAISQAGAHYLKDRKNSYDCIWAISVLEHIHGAYDDRDAIAWMYHALRPGGHLIITVPVDRISGIEYRSRAVYADATEVDGRYFFQRVYDGRALTERLIDTIGTRPTCQRWYGERYPGAYKIWEALWKTTGPFTTAWDPLFMALWFRQFQAEDDMPGLGVCGMVFRKPPIEVLSS